MKFINQNLYEEKIKIDLNNNYRWFDYHNFYDFIINKYNPKVFVEIGCWKGHSISYLSSKASKNSILYAIDLWSLDLAIKTIGKLEYEKIKDFYGDFFNEDLFFDIFLENIKNINNIKPIRKSSIDAASFFDYLKVDFVFIDADHSYSSVTNDLLCWMKVIKKSKFAIIAGHDYKINSVRSAVQKVIRSNLKVFDYNCWYYIHNNYDKIYN